MAIKIILFIVLILFLIGAVIWAFIAFENESVAQGIIATVLGVIFLVTVVLVPGSIHQVKTGEVAVVRHFGVIENSKGPGLYYQSWLGRSYEYYDTKVQQVKITTPAYSSDGQTLDIEVVIQYKVQQDKIVEIATQYGDLNKLESRIEVKSIYL